MDNKYVRRLLPAVMVIVVVLALALLYARRQTEFRELYPEDGVLDVTETDFSDEVFNVTNNWDFYPNALYSHEDFAGETTPEKCPPEERDAGEKFGTYRLVIKARPGEYYALCSFSMDYAMRAFVNGAEACSFGTVADSAGEAVPKTGYMTIPLFSGEDGEIEIIYQYSNFVHKDSSFIQPTFLSTPQNIEEFKAGNDMVSLSLGGALVALALYFLLGAAVERQTDYLCLAFCCLVMACRDQNFFSCHLLSPDVSWYLGYRLFIADTALLPCAAALLLASMYRSAVKGAVTAAYCAVIAAVLALIAFLPTVDLVAVCTAAYWASAPFALYLGYVIVGHYAKGRRFKTGDALVVGGFAVLLASLLVEALMTNRSSAVSHYGVAPSGMIVFVLLMSASISLRTRQHAADLAESRNRGEMLERMNTMNMDFLHNVAHELKTPLTVISGYAQLTDMQITAGHVNGETQENLRTIQQEARRLGDMVTKLLDYSYGRQSETLFGTVEIQQVFDSVRAVCTPMCIKNGNAVAVSGADSADVYGNYEMLMQILINLVVNANKHTRDGRITISASDGESKEYVTFRVSDTGDGISEEQLPHVFEKKYSGDGGSGLGLAICRDAVELHGGTIDVERTGPEGTVMVFTVLRKEWAQ